MCIRDSASGAALGVVGIASYIGAGLQDVMSGVLIEGNKQLVDGVEAVSYTHLDVYKRQVGARSNGEDCQDVQLAV